MAVTTQVYTVSPPYSAADFAGIWRSALIDAGHMTEWHDSFASGSVLNRVLEYTYDGSKTYGKTYYWFMFSGADMFMHFCTGWNTGSDIPAGVGGAGTALSDWISTSTNTTANHLRLAGLNSNQAITIKRYTSGTFTIFLFVNGTTNYTLIIDRTAPLSAWIDLNKEAYMGAMFARARVPSFSSTAIAHFQSYPIRLRRSFLGKMMRGDNYSVAEFGASNTASPPYENLWAQGLDLTTNHVYGAVGNDLNSTANYAFFRPVILLPNGFGNVNSAFSPDEKQPFDNLVISPYSDLKLPAGEFVIYPVYDNNTLQVGSIFKVNPNVEEYEIIACANSTALNDRPSIVIGARIV